MQPLLARRRTLRRARSNQYVTQPQSMAISRENAWLQSESRYEPETFGACTVPTDAYTAWVQQREADRDRSDAPVRWVVRPRPAAVAPSRERADRSSVARLTTV